MGYDERQDLVRSYRAMPETLRALVGSTGSAAAERRSGDDWSIAEVVCHLLDTEQRMYERVLRIRDENEPALPVFPDDDYAARPIVPTLDALTRLRLEHARLLESLPAEGWDRVGVHERLGRLSILDITRHLAAHDADHLAQIARQVTDR